jgi:hypothetical protein
VEPERLHLVEQGDRVLVAQLVVDVGDQRRERLLVHRLVDVAHRLRHDLVKQHRPAVSAGSSFAPPATPPASARGRRPARAGRAGRCGTPASASSGVREGQMRGSSAFCMVRKKQPSTMSWAGATIGEPSAGENRLCVDSTARAPRPGVGAERDVDAIWSPSKSALNALQTSGWSWIALPSTSSARTPGCPGGAAWRAVQQDRVLLMTSSSASQTSGASSRSCAWPS